MLTTAIIFIAILSILIFVHEFGHFAAAKLNGVYVEEFAIGMPPKLFKKRVGETVYSIGLLPIGGYVKLAGEERAGEAEDKESPLYGRKFYEKSALAKLSVMLAGVAMNFLLAVVLLMVVLGINGESQANYAIGIDEIEPNSPAAQSTLTSGEYVVGIRDGSTSEFQKIESVETFTSVIKNNLGKEIYLEVVEEIPDSLDTPKEIAVTPAAFFNENEGSLGVHISVVSFVTYSKVSWYQVPGLALKQSVELVGLMLNGLHQMILNLFKGIVPNDVAGPLGIAVISREIADQGILPLIEFVALISLNLAVVNLLPFPALDGGRIVFVIAEIILGRSLDNKVQQWIHLIGIVVLLGLMGLITIHDFLTFF
ncbi:site-2 protease family protein [candidate division WWE3 bacterium]|uniref:Site-2 protease family protein n=1 Tax=candidate division WWE3 bacterium TaxID=2053526 RepID=A0A955LHR1_UNCKA|nr:site-2 protease family protein [candidate division WWE3 bacterium]